MKGNANTLLIGGFSRSSMRLQPLLDEVVRLAADELQTDASALLLLDDLRQTLALKANVGLDGSAVDAVRLPRDTGVSWRIVREGKPVALAQASADPDFHYVPLSGEDRFVSMLGVPIIDEGEILGALYVQSVETKEYTPDDVAALESVAARAAGPIRTARDLERYETKERIWTRLNEAALQINATNCLNEIIHIATRCATELAGARNQIVWLTGASGALNPNHTPESTGDPEWMRPVFDGIVAATVEKKEVITVANISADTHYPGLGRVASSSVVCLPFIFEGEIVGVMLLADRVTESEDYYSPFSSEEVHSLQILCQTVAQALVRARTHLRLEEALEKNEQNVRELSILFQLSMAMRRTIKLDDLLRVILSCVTVGSGLGFNRAIMFLINESTGLLQGMIGMGPDSPEQAGQIWGDMERRQPEDLVQWLLERDPYEIQQSQFNKMARTLRLSVTGNRASPIASAVVNQKMAVNVRGREDLAPGDEVLLDALACDRFAMVPLAAKDTVLGAILVDNCYNKISITNHDIQLLTRFAAPAAWAIENLKLFERWATVNKELFSLERQMAQVERMSALGEVTAEIAHELKNPLVTVGGFARRLIRSLPETAHERVYASIIVQEVERLEGLLRSALEMSRGMTIHREATDLNAIVKDAVDFYWRTITDKNITVRMKLQEGLETISIDASWIRQVVINLILNAIEAMSCEKHAHDRILTLKTESTFEPVCSVRMKISDTGGGMAEDDFNKIFDPFFTTKSQGTGLGLSLCKKIVRLHHGSMEIDNKLGVGVTFTINLPCQTADNNHLSA